MPPIESSQRLALINPDSAVRVAWLDDDEHEVLRIAGEFGGRIVFTWRNRDVCGLGRWGPEGDVTWVETRVCGGHARLLGDGRVVGDAGGDVVVVDDAGTHRYLTETELRERYPRAGARIFFERLGQPRYGRSHASRCARFRFPIEVSWTLLRLSP